MKTIISITLASALLAGCASIQHEPISRMDDHDTPASHGNLGSRSSFSVDRTRPSSTQGNITRGTTPSGKSITTYNDTLSAR